MAVCAEQPARGLPPWLRRSSRALFLVALAGAGAVVALSVAGTVHHRVGPFEARLSVHPVISGETRVAVPPLGSLSFDTHRGPLQLRVDVTELRLDAARDIMARPDELGDVGDRAAADVREALVALAVRATLAAAVGAALPLLLVLRRARPAVLAAAAAVCLLATSGAIAAGTWRTRALAEPRYRGLLTQAPALIGDSRDIVERFDVYRAQLAGLLTTVSQLYDVTSTLPVLPAKQSLVRVLHVSDLHLNPAAWDVIRTVVRQYDVDAVVDTGDLADHGLSVETAYVRPIARLGVPFVHVRGNHDSARIEQAVRRSPGAVVLDGTMATVAGLRIFGLGDPRFTPDKRTRDELVTSDDLVRAGRAAVVGLALAGRPPDVVLVHDPTAAREFLGAAPLVLAGHTHARRSESAHGSLLLVQGSTGGAGLRALDGSRPAALECSVLYFDRRTSRLVARDELTVGGLGIASASVQRHVTQGVGAAALPR